MNIDEEIKSDEPSDPMQTLILKYNLSNGDIDFEMPTELNRMQIRSILANALVLLDADIVSEAFENKMRAIAAQRAQAKMQQALMSKGLHTLECHTLLTTNAWIAPAICLHLMLAF